jgi:hypothetical protein
MERERETRTAGAEERAQTSAPTTRTEATTASTEKAFIVRYESGEPSFTAPIFGN